MQQNISLAEAMKRGMRQLASGVCILSITDAAGECHAMTATSVTSLSDSPASLLACVNQSHRINTAFSLGAKFAVNVLAHSHESLSNLCADSSRADQRFGSDKWQFADGQAPWVSDALAVFQCECAKKIAYGTHDIVIGEILGAYTPAEGSDPLLYFDGAYASIKTK